MAGAPRLSALPLGCALFGEGARAFEGVLGGAGAVNPVVIAVERVLEGKMEALKRGLLGSAHGEGRVLQDLIGPALGGGRELVRGYDFVDQTPAGSLLGAD